MKTLALSLLLLSAPAHASEVWTYWITPCTEQVAAESTCKPGDAELARWALEAWQRTAESALVIKPARSEAAARLRVYWVTGRSQLYGEARPFSFAGQRGAEVYVLPSAAKAGEDPLDRDTVVYLTCLHEAGHALGLAHTSSFADIMYSFQYGGNIPEYFGRYRRKLATRTDIAKTSAISLQDRAALLAALANP